MRSLRLLLPLSALLILTAAVQAQEPEHDNEAPAAESSPAIPEPTAAPQPEAAAPQPEAAAPQPKAAAPQPKAAAPQPEAAAPQPEAASEPQTATPPTAGYNKGFFIQSEDGLYKVKINGRVQVRLGLNESAGLFTTAPQADPMVPIQFSIPRARLKMGGKVFTQGLGYTLQLDFGKGFVALKDFYLDYAIDSEWLSVRAGQFRRPFSRQQLNSSGALALVERAITDKFFGAGRDIGVMLHNGFGKNNAFEYAVGVFNGSGAKGTFSGSVDFAEDSVTGAFSNLPGRFDPMLVMRAGYNYGGLKRYSEGDFEGGDLRFGVGASSQLNFNADERVNEGSVDIGVDMSLKVSGFSLDAEFFVAMEQETGTVGGGNQQRVGWASQELSAMGLYAQAGYVIAERYLPMVRFETVMPQGTDNDTTVVTAGFGAFFFQHNLKLQTEFSYGDQDKPDIRIRTQLQLAF